MFLPNKTIKNKKCNYPPTKMSVKITQYGGYVVTFLPTKIIKTNKFNYPQKNVGLAHGFKTMRKASYTIHGLGGLCKWF